MKNYKLFKLITYIIGGLLVIIFNNELLGYANFLLGSVVTIMSINSLIAILKEKDIKENSFNIAKEVLLINLGIITLFLYKETYLISVCVIWAIWSIIREEWEVIEALHTFKSKVIIILNIIESLALFIVAVLLIFNPNEHHLHIHIILLGIELVLEVLFPHFDYLFQKIRNNKLNNEK